MNCLKQANVIRDTYKGNTTRKVIQNEHNKTMYSLQ